MKGLIVIGGLLLGHWAFAQTPIDSASVKQLTAKQIVKLDQKVGLNAKQRKAIDSLYVQREIARANYKSATDSAARAAYQNEMLLLGDEIEMWLTDEQRKKLKAKPDKSSNQKKQ